MSPGNFDVSNYVDVAERIRLFAEKHPEGCLRPAFPSQPYTIEKVGEQTFIVYTAAAYRSPEDPRPGIGVAWEVVPGKTNFTRDSELQNAETSAWGRAIVATLAADTKRGISSREEVEARNGSTGAHDRKREVVQALIAKKLPTNGTLAELEARLQDSVGELPATDTDGSGGSGTAVDSPLPSAEPEERIASGPCADCGRGDTKKVLGAEGRVLCKDRKGCADRVAKLEEPF